jgi:hypothetical protein
MSVDAILREARAAVAGGGDPDWKALRDRIRGAARDDAARSHGLTQLERIGAVHRARRAQPSATAADPLPRRAALRTRPSLAGDLDVRRERSGDSFELVWPADQGVERWEVRIAERSGTKSDYVALGSQELPAATTRLALPLEDVPLRVHVLGRSRAGRLVRRAIASGLTRGSWDERWQRRPS